MNITLKKRIKFTPKDKDTIQTLRGFICSVQLRNTGLPEFYRKEIDRLLYKYTFYLLDNKTQIDELYHRYLEITGTPHSRVTKYCFKCHIVVVLYEMPKRTTRDEIYELYGGYGQAAVEFFISTYKK